jgi:hypothetical protein
LQLVLAAARRLKFIASWTSLFRTLSIFSMWFLPEWVI